MVRTAGSFVDRAWRGSPSSRRRRCARRPTGCSEAASWTFMRKPDNAINARYLDKRGDGVSAARVVVHLAAVATPLLLIAVLPVGLHDGVLVAIFGVLMNGM